MLARVLMEELKDEPVRLNDLVLYSSFGWGNDDANQVSGSDIGRYVAHLLSASGSSVRGGDASPAFPDMVQAAVATGRRASDSP